MKKAAVILIFNSHGELLLQKRAAEEKSHPNHWDFSAAGGIEENEIPEAGAHRELMEELGIKTHLVFVGQELYKDDAGSEELYFYCGKWDNDFHPNPIEVKEVAFYSLQHIQLLINQRELFHPEFQYYWQKGFIQQFFST